MRNLIFLFLLGITAMHVHAQSLVTYSLGSTGGTSTAVTGPTLHWHVGEAVIGQFCINDVLNIGLIQNLDISSALSDHRFSFDLASVWPNPTIGSLYISNKGQNLVQVQLLDLHGQVVQKLGPALGDQVTQNDLRQLPAGSYFLLLSNSFDQHQIIKIQKI